MEKEDDALESGALAGTMRSAMERIRPEASYFFEEDGKRACLFVFNLDLQSLLTPLFQDLDANVQVTPVMNSAEFEQGLGDVRLERGVGGADPGWRRTGQAREPRQVVEESELMADISPGARRSATGDAQPHDARVERRKA